MARLANSTERLNFRLGADIKRVIERAASLKGQSLTDYAIAILERESRDVVEHYETLVLSDRDRQAFLAALDHPPVANEKLRSAAKRYKDAASAGRIR